MDQRPTAKKTRPSALSACGGQPSGVGKHSKNMHVVRLMLAIMNCQALMTPTSFRNHDTLPSLQKPIINTNCVRDYGGNPEFTLC